MVYRKTQGGNLTPRTWSQEPGLYKVDIKGKQNMKISADGYQAQFGANADRVFFMNSSEDETPQLSSINLDGFDKRVHYSSKHATEFRVSPDGEQLAFAERFKVWVTPFAKHGETVEIGPQCQQFTRKSIECPAPVKVLVGTVKATNCIGRLALNFIKPRLILNISIKMKRLSQALSI